MQSAFVPVNNQPAENEETILMDVFTRMHRNGVCRSHLLVLSHKYILYYRDETQSQIRKAYRLDFEAKFGMIKDAKGEVVGIKFERQGYESYDLYCKEKYVLKGWELELQKRVNKRGFHEQFRPLKKIGKGNFASVYLASRVFDHRKVAVKAFSKEMLQGQQKGIESIINQVKLLRQFNHQNIIKLLAVYESQNSIYLVMEHLEGNPLQSLLSKHVFTLNQSRNIMKGLLEGIAQLAAKNVVHRDLKTQNLMFRSTNIDSGIVILDFGLATFCDEQEYIYTRCGTPGYVSPEIVNIKDMATARCSTISDVFSAGVIFHILLMKRSPFRGRTFNQVLHENRICKIELTTEEYKFVDRKAYDLMGRMLERDPQRRITAKECLGHPFFTQMENNPQAMDQKYSKEIMGLSTIIKDKLQVRNH